MNSILLKLIDVYAKQGYSLRTGLNPCHYDTPPWEAAKWSLSLPFSCLYKGSGQLYTGGGIALQELYFLEILFTNYHPRNLFVIGNAFGWSTIALSLLNPRAKVVAIDAGIEGRDNLTGIELTNRIIREENLNAKVEYGFSPQDTPKVLSGNFDAPLDFVFIDGLHTNEQLEKDYFETAKHAAPDCVWLFHDVVNWHMRTALETITRESGLRSQILHRTPSGMAILYSKQMHEQLESIVNAFSESEYMLSLLPPLKRPPPPEAWRVEESA